MFDDDDARSIRESKDLMEKESLRTDLAYIKCHLSFLPPSIKMLEESGLSLVDSTAIVSKVKEKIEDLPGAKGKLFKDKMDQVLKKNSNFKIFQDVAKVQAGESDSACPSGWTPDDISELKFCPITSVDVERSFSIYKHIFNSRRHKLTEENLEKIVVANCFYAREQ